MIAMVQKGVDFAQAGGTSQQMAAIQCRAEQYVARQAVDVQQYVAHFIKLAPTIGIAAGQPVGRFVGVFAKVQPGTHRQQLINQQLIQLIRHVEQLKDLHHVPRGQTGEPAQHWGQRVHLPVALGKIVRPIDVGKEELGQSVIFAPSCKILMIAPQTAGLKDLQGAFVS